VPADGEPAEAGEHGSPPSGPRGRRGHRPTKAVGRASGDGPVVATTRRRARPDRGAGRGGPRVRCPTRTPVHRVGPCRRSPRSRPTPR
jgi:hypothetical protein